jgi:hypothetical protein
MEKEQIEKKPLDGEIKTGEKEDKKNKKDKDVVEVKKEVLEKLLERVDSLEKRNEILTEAADKGRLSRVEQLRNQGKLVKSVFINTYNEKIIVGWKKIKDDVYKDQEGRLHEDQVVGLIFEGEDEVGTELDIRSFVRLLVKIPAEVIEESKDRDGNTNFVVIIKDGKNKGKQLKIDSKFIN